MLSHRERCWGNLFVVRGGIDTLCLNRLESNQIEFVCVWMSGPALLLIRFDVITLCAPLSFPFISDRSRNSKSPNLICTACTKSWKWTKKKDCGINLKIVSFFLTTCSSPEEKCCKVCVCIYTHTQTKCCVSLLEGVIQLTSPEEFQQKEKVKNKKKPTFLKANQLTLGSSFFIILSLLGHLLWMSFMADQTHISIRLLVSKSVKEKTIEAIQTKRKLKVTSVT